MSIDIQTLIGNSQMFPILEKWDFFNHAGVAPLPKAAADALRKYAEQAESTVYLFSNWYEDCEKLRKLSANLIHAHPDEIAFVKNTSEGLSIVAKGIDWQSGDVIVTTAVEYPANIYPWMDLARSLGIRLVMVEEQTDTNGRRSIPTEAILRAAGDPMCRMVSLSAVQYASGQRMDLKTIGKFCRENGKFFCVDAIQALGVLPVDVQEMNIDYLSADGHKWLMGPEGAGIFYCRRELLEKTHPPTIGWMNVINAQDYGNYDFTLRPDARRFECGSWNVPGLLGLKASMQLLRDVGIEAIEKRLKQLTDFLIPKLESRGYQIISPREREQWSGIVSFVSPRHSHDQIVRRLRKEHRTEIALREVRLRVSAHFYNTEAQLNRLIENLPPH